MGGRASPDGGRASPDGGASGAPAQGGAAGAEVGGSANAGGGGLGAAGGLGSTSAAGGPTAGSGGAARSAWCEGPKVAAIVNLQGVALALDTDAVYVAGDGVTRVEKIGGKATQLWVAGKRATSLAL